MKVGKQITEAMLINSSLLKRRYDELISQELVDYKKSSSQFFVRTEGTDKAAVEKVFGTVSYVEAEGVAGELGFVTETMTEAEFEKKTAEFGAVKGFIRMA